MDKVTPTQAEIGDYTVTPADRELVEAIIGHRQYRDIPYQLAARYAEQARREVLATLREHLLSDESVERAGLALRLADNCDYYEAENKDYNHMTRAAIAAALEGQ